MLRKYTLIVVDRYSYILKIDFSVFTTTVYPNRIL